MSGHSHFATIRRTKEVKDAQKGRVFSKHSKAISVAVKTGGGPSPDSNYKLRMAMDAARADNMPKDSIERAVAKASSEAQNLEEIRYEGFGPDGIAVMVEVTTDNKNRTSQEIKNLFERNGGSMGGPGSVSFNFDPKGLLLVKKDASQNADEQMLKLIDAGADDIQDEVDGLEVYTSPESLSKVRSELEAQDQTIIKSELIQRPKTFIDITDFTKAKKALAFLEKVEEQDDVQKVFVNLNIPDEVLNKLEEDSL
jgi:YebC/PmpR family DNA-binding regulatory protein